MFSISFGEMAIILLVVLLVVGPKRLPAMARFVGHLLGRINRQASSLRREINREIELDELRKSMKEAETEAKQAADEVRDTVGEVNEIKDEVIQDKPNPKADG